MAKDKGWTQYFSKDTKDNKVKGSNSKKTNSKGKTASSKQLNRHSQ